MDKFDLVSKFIEFNYKLVAFTLDDDSEKDEDGCLISDPYTFANGDEIIESNDLYEIYSTAQELKKTELKDKDYEITIGAFNDSEQWMFDITITMFDVFYTISARSGITKEDIQNYLDIKFGM